MTRKSQVKSLLPDKDVLAGLHQSFVSLIQRERIIALRGMVSWYENLVPFVRNRFDASQEKALQRALKTRPLCFHPDTPANEAENSLLFCVNLMEKAVADPKLPSIKTAEATLETMRPQLEAALEQRKQAYQGLIDLVNGQTLPLGVTFSVDMLAERPRGFAQGKMIYSASLADELIKTWQNESAVAMLFREIPVILKAASVEVVEGKPSLDFPKYQGNVNALLGGLIDFVHAQFRGKGSQAPTMPKVNTPKVATSRVPRTPRTPNPSATGNPYFRPGKMADVFERLSQAGRISFVDLFNGIGAGDPSRMLGAIIEKGKTLGKWEILKNGVNVEFRWL